jgi:hypothetical protein
MSRANASKTSGPYPTPSVAVDVVVEPESTARRGRLRCAVGQHVTFSTEHLESYCFAAWEPVVYDALLVAAAVEFADRTQRRSTMKWDRQIELRIPVHEPDRWNDSKVLDALHAALRLLTGDQWHIVIYPRVNPAPAPQQGHFDLPAGITAVLPFSDGLDSCAVGALMTNQLGNQLIRVRLGAMRDRGQPSAPRRQPFTCIPYRVLPGARPFAESSSRSRGFKFALVSGLAAYLAKASTVIVSESGQGALGPSLVTVGQGYEDYRSHPLFTDRMEQFLSALLLHPLRFQFPRLWHTKAETLRDFISVSGAGARWAETWSCWQQNRQASVDRKKRQCGICAACMLRRMSVHAAGVSEVPQKYVWESLSASEFEAGAAPSFAKDKITSKLRDYAIAGTLHLDHLAGVPKAPANARSLRLSAYQLSQSLGLPEGQTRTKLDRLLAQHAGEWRNFLQSLGRDSFVTRWAAEADL